MIRRVLVQRDADETPQSLSLLAWSGRLYGQAALEEQAKALENGFGALACSSGMAAVQMAGLAIIGVIIVLVFFSDISKLAGGKVPQ